MELTGDRDWMLEVWIEHYVPACERFFRRRSCSADLVADLRQETLLGIWRNRTAFRGDTEAMFRAWASRIAQTTWLKHWERERRKWPTEPILDDPPSPAADPETLAALEQMQAALKSAIERLPPKMQQVRMLIAQGRTEHEVAIVLGCSVNTVKAHEHQARQKLAQDQALQAAHRRPDRRFE